MPFKTPTSSLTGDPQHICCYSTYSSFGATTVIATELFAAQVWWRGIAKIEQLLFGGTSGTPTLHASPITKLPQELVELIISYFTRDTRTLLACSLTCYSWYIAAVPHLHHTLTTNDTLFPGDGGKSSKWPRSLRNSYNLGLLPFVKRFHIRTFSDPFTPKKLDKYTLRYFSALTNLQELEIDELRVPSFMPNIRQYFGHFTPTLRSLALRDPRGSSRQILYFIGLFPNLQDLKICYGAPNGGQEGTAGAGLVPLSAPPLCGRLTLKCFARGKLVKDMITFFGGLHFRHMDLFRVSCVRLLLGACADTLEGLRLYPTDPYGEQSLRRGAIASELKLEFAENCEAVRRAFDLSRNTSLRTLETTAISITIAGDVASGFLKTILSTVTSTLPLDLLINYGVAEVCFHTPPYSHVFQQDRAAEALVHRERFKVFSEMYAVREFHLVLRADVSDRMTQVTTRALGWTVKEGLDHLPCKPVIQ